MTEPFWRELFANPLLARALVVGLISSILSGVLGTYVVAKRLGSLSGSISHVILAGLGGSLYCQRVLGWSFASPLLGAFISALIAAIAIGSISLYYGENQEGLITAFWPLGMAIGFLFIHQTPGSNLELNNYLFGNILWASSRDINILLALDTLVLALVGLCFKQLLAICFDEEMARLQGVRTRGLYLLLLGLIAAGIVVMTYIVGTILVLTLLTLPPLIATRWANSMFGMMVLATALSALFCTLGLYLSFTLDLPTGALISLTAGCAHGGSLVASSWWKTR